VNDTAHGLLLDGGLLLYAVGCRQLYYWRVRRAAPPRDVIAPPPARPEWWNEPWKGYE
jgi:hypothetical protein